MKKIRFASLALAVLLAFGVSAPVIAHRKRLRQRPLSPPRPCEKEGREESRAKTRRIKRPRKNPRHKATAKKRLPRPRRKKPLPMPRRKRKSLPWFFRPRACCSVTPPSMTVATAAHPRSMAEMARPPGKSSAAPKQVVQHFYDDLLGA